ncbi:hypothetical protein U6A24_10535 [Aquimarina gracilis]|uniref:Secreted protein n=1 Tax=Aquimarina gracilis TaxID=874422 RepID=A0ABU5ZVJ2_9FLAO|nr:hypothetical protein [Aquimarina gracilis]MEB3345902.1 hypothetical protein [Aquimarina gracilis]
MKTIKTLFAVVVVSTMFIACEADSVNEEIGIDNLETFSDEQQLPEGPIGNENPGTI